MVNVIGKGDMNIKMKSHYLLIVLIGITHVIIARDVQETVLKAHKQYEQGNIEQALTLYNSIEKKGPATWYNLGNCHYKQKNYMDALVCWKKAERDASWSELPALYHNIDEAYKTLNVQHGYGFKVSMYRTIKRILALFSLFGWQLLFLLFWVVLLFFAARLARAGRYALLSSFCLLVVLFGGCLYKKYDLISSRSGVIVEKDLVVYSGPGVDFHELGTLVKATEINICEEQADWLKVREHDLVGWIPMKKVEIV